MTTKGVADIVFCLDASDSMRPCIEGVRSHIADFITGMQSNPQFQWDWRLDFVAHSAAQEGATGGFRIESLAHDSDFVASLYSGGPAGRFFTNDLREFQDGLSRVQVFGDEAPLVALDCCLDLPWREATRCHRIVILMTDEPFETGVLLDEQRAMLPTLIEKIQRLRVMLFIVAPESAALDELSVAEKCVYETVDQSGDGLARVDFGDVLAEIGKSVSVCDWQMPKPESAPRGLFGQSSWTEGGPMSTSDRTTR